MRKLAVFLSWALVLIGSCSAQDLSVSFPGSPTGTCTYQMYAEDTTTQKTYFCPAGKWEEFSGARPSVSSRGFIGNTITSKFQGTPSGTCDFPMQALDVVNQVPYLCLNKTWVPYGKFSAICPTATDTQVLFVDGTTCAGDANFIWNKTFSYVSVTGSVFATAPAVGGLTQGVYGEADVSDTDGIAIGLQGVAKSAGSNNISVLTALQTSVVHNSSGVLDEVFNLDVQPPTNIGGGSITNTSGLWIESFAGVGTTRNHAIHIVNQGTGATDKAIFVEGGNSDLGPDTTTVGRLKTANAATFADGDATPSVLAGNIFLINNTGATTITAFDDGVNGQTITVACVDATTVISDAGTLRLSAGFTCTTDDTLTLIFTGTNWLETTRSVN